MVAEDQHGIRVNGRLFYATPVMLSWARDWNGCNVEVDYDEGGYVRAIVKRNLEEKR